MSDYYAEPDYDDFPLFSRSVVEHREEPDDAGDLDSEHSGNEYNEDSESATRKRAEILQALKSGPISTYDIEHNWHRGQATVHELRQRGHGIKREVIEGRTFYRYLGSGPRTKIPKTSRELYYDTPWWKSQSRLRKEMDGFACRQCGEATNLEVHHWRYRLFRESVTHDLITLCGDCHKLIHDSIKGSSCGFPARLTDEDIQEIRQLPDGRGLVWLQALVSNS